jgi:Uma2 family endonuclease
MLQTAFESARTMTPAEFAEWVAKRPRGDVYRYELLNRRVVMNPPAGYPHGEIGANIQFLLGSHVRQHRLGRVFDSSQGFELPSGDTVEPDHSFVSTARWNAAAAPEPGAFLRVVPDLIVEVLSSTNASYDRGEKKAIYERNGVREYGLVDWRTREVTVFRLGDAGYDLGAVHSDREKVTSAVLAGLVLAVAEILV